MVMASFNHDATLTNERDCSPPLLNDRDPILQRSSFNIDPGGTPNQLSLHTATQILNEATQRLSGLLKLSSGTSLNINGNTGRPPVRVTYRRLEHNKLSNEPLPVIEELTHQQNRHITDDVHSPKMNVSPVIPMNTDISISHVSHTSTNNYTPPLTAFSITQSSDNKERVALTFSEEHRLAEAIHEMESHIYSPEIIDIEDQWGVDPMDLWVRNPSPAPDSDGPLPLSEEGSRSADDEEDWVEQHKNESSFSEINPLLDAQYMGLNMPSGEDECDVFSKNRSLNKTPLNMEIRRSARIMNKSGAGTTIDKAERAA